MSLLRAFGLFWRRGRFSLWLGTFVPPPLTFRRQMPMNQCTLISVHCPGEGLSHAPRAARSEASGRRDRLRCDGRQDSDRRDRRAPNTEIGPHSQWASGGDGARQKSFGRGPQKDRQKGSCGSVALMKMFNLFRNERKILRFQIDWDRCIEGIAYISKLKPGVTQYYIGKIFYFADKSHFLDWGRPISGDRYIAMEHGPVPSNIYDLLKEGAGEPDEVVDCLYRRVKIETDGNKRRVFSRENENFPHLSGTDKGYLEVATKKYASMSFDELRRLAHKEAAWVEAEKQLGLNNEMNLIHWAEELGANAEAIAADVEERQYFRA
jgi:uncharacterized phage-associated protein